MFVIQRGVIDYVCFVEKEEEEEERGDVLRRLCVAQNKSMEQRLNLSRSQCKDCSHAYNTPFLS